MVSECHVFILLNQSLLTWSYPGVSLSSSTPTFPITTSLPLLQTHSTASTLLPLGKVIAVSGLAFVISRASAFLMLKPPLSALSQDGMCF